MNEKFCILGKNKKIKEALSTCNTRAKRLVVNKIKSKNSRLKGSSYP